MNCNVWKERTCGSKIRKEVLEYVNELEMGGGGGVFGEKEEEFRESRRR